MDEGEIVWRLESTGGLGPVEYSGEEGCPREDALVEEPGTRWRKDNVLVSTSYRVTDAALREGTDTRKASMMGHCGP